MGLSMSKSPDDMLQAGKLCKAAKEAHATLVGGESVSGTAEELADHIGETHEVVGEAVEKLVEGAGKLIDGTIGTDGLGAVAKLAVEGVENIVLSPVQDVSRVIEERGSEAAHTVARKVLEATGVTADGMPDVQPSSVDLDMFELGAKAEHAAGEVVETLAGNAGSFIDGTIGTDGSGAAAMLVVEGVGDAASDIVVTTLKTEAGEIALELLDTALDGVPVVGQCLCAWKILRGAITATVGVAALTVSASVAAAAYVTAEERTKQVARKIAWWGVSVAGEGTCLAAKGATNMVNVVPATQFITFPLSIGLGVASKRCGKMRSE